MSINHRITAAAITCLALSAGGAISLAATKHPGPHQHRHARVRPHSPHGHTADTANCSALSATIKSTTDPTQVAALKAQIQNQCVDPNQPTNSGPKPPAQNGNPGPPPTDTTGKSARQPTTPTALPPTKPIDQPGS